MQDGDQHLADFTLFLKGTSTPEFAEVDSICVPKEFFVNTFCILHILPLYFHITRVSSKTPIARLKRMFHCGSELAMRVKKAVAERKQIPLKRSGKKPMRNDPSLIRLVDQTTTHNGHVSDGELAALLGTSRTTINNIRHDLKFDYKALRHGPVLTQRQVEARLAFCRDNVDQDWSAVMFTDESRVSTSPDSPVMWWVKRGQHIYVESHKFPPSIMIWAGIIGPMKTPLIKCPQRLNAQAYVEMLEARGVHNFMHWCGDTSIFQQDGAPCHTAASSLRWFRDQGVRVLPNWPANSPDLSPVEQIWAIVKRYIMQRFGMRTPLTLDQLEAAVFEAYTNISWRTIGILTMSAKYRVQACIARDGRFVGDLIGECCRRARVELETQSDILLLSLQDIPAEPPVQNTRADDNEDRNGSLLPRYNELTGFPTMNAHSPAN